MQLVIEIPEEVFNEIVSADDASHLSIAFLRGSYLYFKEALQNSTPLPKGHGRLIDADAFIKTMEDASKRHKYKGVLINNCLTVDDVFKAVIGSLQNEGLANGDSPTIIEADKGDGGNDG